MVLGGCKSTNSHLMGVGAKNQRWYAARKSVFDTRLLYRTGFPAFLGAYRIPREHRGAYRPYTWVPATRRRNRGRGMCVAGVRRSPRDKVNAHARPSGIFTAATVRRSSASLAVVVGCCDGFIVRRTYTYVLLLLLLYCTFMPNFIASFLRNLPTASMCAPPSAARVFVCTPLFLFGLVVDSYFLLLLLIFRRRPSKRES